MSHDPDRENELARCEAVDRILAALYADGPDTQWNADTVDTIADIVQPFRTVTPDTTGAPEGALNILERVLKPMHPSCNATPPDTTGEDDADAVPVCPHCGSNWVCEVGSTQYEQDIELIGFRNGFREVTEFGERTDFVESDEFDHYECKNCELEHPDLSAFVPGTPLFIELKGKGDAVLPL